MARMTEQEKQDIIRYLEADKPLPDKYRFLRNDDCRSGRVCRGSHQALQGPWRTRPVVAGTPCRGGEVHSCRDWRAE